MQTSEPALEWKGISVPSSPFLGPEIAQSVQSGTYEEEEIAGALALIKPDDRVLELGAGLGIVGTVIGVHAKPARHIAYEANPKLIPHIQEIYALNGLQDSHEIRNRLLMSAPDIPDSLPFHVHVSFLGSSTTKSSTHTKQTVDVPTERYKDLCAEFSPDVLIIDIEGAERDFLKHADLSSLRAIVIEFHPEHYGLWGTLLCKFRLYRAGFRPVKALSHSTVWACEKSK